jgi:protein DGCR14
VFAPPSSGCTAPACALTRRANAPQPLHHAAAADSAELVAALVAAGADVERATASGTPLHWAAGESAARATAALLRAGAAPDAADADGMPPLLLAVAGGAGAVVEALLAAGAQPAAAALPGGATVLHVAAEGGDRRCIAALLRCAAGREMCAARDAEGFTPRDVAEASGHEDVLPLFDAAS